MIRSALAPLAERDVRHLFLGQTTSTFGNAFASVALAFAVLQTTGSIANVGLALAAMRVPLLAFTLLGGVVGDRLQRRAVLLTADIARFVSQGAAALLLLTDNARLWELLALFACHGLAQAFFSPTMVGLVSEVTPPRHLQQTNALFAFSQSAAGATGMLVGGALVSIAGPGYAFGIDALSFLVSAVALATLQLHAVPARIAGATTLLRDLRAGWDAFRTRRWLWVGTVHISLLNAFALSGFFALGPVVAARDLGGGYAWGVIGALFACGMAGGALTASRVSPRRPLLAAFGVVMLAAPQLALLALAAPLPLIALAAFFGGAQVAFWGALWTTTLQREIPNDVLARVTSFSQVGTLLFAPLGLATVGIAAGAFGVATVLWVGAVWTVISTAAVLLLNGGIRHYVRPADDKKHGDPPKRAAAGTESD